jgi:hypothetical protein
VTVPAFRDEAGGHDRDVGSERTAVQAVFRRANEDLVTLTADLLGDDPEAPAPFLCECADPGCTRVIRVWPAEWEDACSQPGHFVVLPGHERQTGDEEVVARRDRFSLVRTVGAHTCA